MPLVPIALSREIPPSLRIPVSLSLLILDLKPHARLPGLSRLRSFIPERSEGSQTVPAPRIRIPRRQANQAPACPARRACPRQASSIQPPESLRFLRFLRILRTFFFAGRFLGPKTRPSNPQKPQFPQKPQKPHALVCHPESRSLGTRDLHFSPPQVACGLLAPNACQGWFSGLGMTRWRRKKRKNRTRQAMEVSARQDALVALAYE